MAAERSDDRRAVGKAQAEHAVRTRKRNEKRTDGLGRGNASNKQIGGKQNANGGTETVLIQIEEEQTRQKIADEIYGGGGQILAEEKSEGKAEKEREREQGEDEQRRQTEGQQQQQQEEAVQAKGEQKKGTEETQANAPIGDE